MKFVTVKCIDNLGRLLIPSEMRRFYGILPGITVGMTLKDNVIIISKEITKTQTLKKVDKLGRIIIPKNIRARFNSVVKIVPCDNEIHLIFT